VIPLFLARIAPYAIISALVIISGFAAGQWIKEQGRKELRPQIERLETALAAERADRARAERAADSYQSEMERLRERTLNRTVNRTPVRLCVTPAPQGGAAPEGTNDPAPAPRSDDGSAGSNPQAGPDIGADLYALVAACDAENAKLRALQGWILDGG
jgi:ABC-type Fe3+-hydroxamate transport system substrate-binding protein